MALTEHESTFIKVAFRPIVDLRVVHLMGEGHTLESAWEEFLKVKPEDATEDTHNLMREMFNESWAELTEEEK